MQEKQLFEYAIIRVMPQVERGEFINVGVIVYCAKQRFLEIRFDINTERLLAFSDKIDVVEVEKRLRAFEFVCLGIKDGGPIGKLPLASRFRWLIASRSTVVQTSPVHPGLCTDPHETLVRLMDQMVG
jgi:hypothetical protein